jgi:hypothetical protein
MQQLVSEQYGAGELIEVRVSKVFANLSGLRSLKLSQLVTEYGLGRSHWVTHDTVE